MVGGYDDQKKVFYLGDTERAGWQEVSFESLKKATGSNIPPLSILNNYKDIEKISIGSMDTALIHALSLNAASFLDTQYPLGLEALKFFMKTSSTGQARYPTRGSGA